MARVSILLPVYNGRRFLPAAIESVLAQTFSDWQLLICDDRSIDDSFEIAERYAQQDSRVRVFRNPGNLGLFANYNRCLALAVECGSEYIKPFAQDDILYQASLESLVKVLDENDDVALVSCGRNWIADDGTTTGNVRPFKADRKIKGEDVIIYNLIQLTNWVGEPSTVLFRAARAGSGFDTEMFHYGDIDYWFRIVADSHYYYLDENLCGFRRHSSSATSKNLNGLYFGLDIMRLGKRYKRQLEQLGESESHFYKRAVETIALNLDHLVRGEGLTAESMLCAKRGGSQPLQTADSNEAMSNGIVDCSPDARSAVENNGTENLTQEDGFREIAFHALRYLTDMLYQYSDLKHRTDAEREDLERQLASMKESTSWKITAPLRNIMRSGKEG